MHLVGDLLGQRLALLLGQPLEDTQPGVVRDI